MNAFQDLSVSFVYSLVTFVLFNCTHRHERGGGDEGTRNHRDQHTNKRCAEVKFRLFKYLSLKCPF